MTTNCKKTDKPWGITEEELDKIVKEEMEKLDIAPSPPEPKTIQEQISLQTDREIFGEAVVVTQKKFKQVSDHVSEQTKIAHEKLYANYVEAFNATSAHLDSIPRKDANSYTSVFRSTKLDEVHNLNGLWLHELYFANCFDPHSQIHMDSKAFMRINRDFGGFDRWQKDFMACALSVGEGWVVLGYHMYSNRYVNMFIEENDKSVMFGVYPVLVLDMFSHSYFRDFDVDKKSYIVTMMRQIDWNIVEERIDKTEKIAEALK